MLKSLAVINMLLGYVSFAIAFIATEYVLANEDDEVTELLGSCFQLLNPKMIKEHCCVSAYRIMHDHKDINMRQRCNLSDDREFSCDDAKCVLQEMGIWDNEKEEVDEEKVMQRIEENHEKYGELKGMLQKMKDRCLNGKYKTMLLDNLCLQLKYVACIYLSGATSCTDWKDSETCKKMPEHAEKCNQIIDSI